MLWVTFYRLSNFMLLLLHLIIILSNFFTPCVKEFIYVCNPMDMYVRMYVCQCAVKSMYNEFQWLSGK